MRTREAMSLWHHVLDGQNLNISDDEFIEMIMRLWNCNRKLIRRKDFDFSATWTIPTYAESVQAVAVALIHKHGARVTGCNVPRIAGYVAHWRISTNGRYAAAGQENR